MILENQRVSESFLLPTVAVTSEVAERGSIVEIKGCKVEAGVDRESRQNDIVLLWLNREQLGGGKMIEEKLAQHF